MQVYEEMTPQEREEELLEVGRTAVRKASGSLVLWQAALCVIVLLAALVLKYFLPDFYGALRTQYDAEMERSILITYDDVSNS